MAITETDLKAHHRGSGFNGGNVDFYSRLTELTKNLSSSQLAILREHVSKIQLSSRAGASASPGPQHSALSSRETEVLILVTNGYSRRDIGTALDISVNTAARHIANIYQKLGISCVAEATHYALMNDIVGNISEVSANPVIDKKPDASHGG